MPTRECAVAEKVPHRRHELQAFERLPEKGVGAGRDCGG
jgi:hypothetical protein